MGAEQNQARLGVLREVPRPPRRRWPGFRSRGRTRRSGGADGFAGLVIGGSDFASGGRLCLFSPVALPVQFQNMDMVGETIEQRAGETLALKDACPFLEWKIRRDNGRAALVALAEDLEEEQLGASLGEWHVAE